MAGDDLVVSADTLRGGAEGLRSVADDFSSSWSSFTAAVDSMGDIFGDDDIGGLIGVSHQLAQQIAGEAFGSVTDALTACAEGLSTMADAHEGNEADSQSLFTGTEV